MKSRLWVALVLSLGWTVAAHALPGAFSLTGNAYCNTSPPTAPAVKLTWGASSTATSYTVYRNGAFYAGPYGSTQLTFDNTANVAAGQTYTYFIRAANSSGSKDSNTITVSVSANICGGAPAPGTFTLSGNAYCNTSSPAAPAVKLTWGASSNATSYTIYRNGSSYSGPYGSSQLTFDNTANVAAGQTYTYFIRAANANGSTDSNTITVNVPSNVCASAQAPGAFTLSGNAYCNTSPPTAPAVKLTWGGSSNATSYTVYRNGSSYSGPYGSSQLTFDNTSNVAAGQSYTYFIRAANGNGTTDSNTITVSVPSSVCAGAQAPGAFSLSGNAYCNTSSPTAPAVKLTWATSSNASNYTVYRNGSSYSGPYSSAQLTFDNTANVVAGQTYTYFIRASNANGSTDSNTITVNVPAAICDSVQAPGSFTLSGNAYCDTGAPVAPAVKLTW
ncbi:MAG TPA: hypothetical protein VN181_00135, partial [Thermoanaerobaculia bacterium]|nr:hypothetical protein [Thermoanaerobaculia bacterium]